jgi:hypothetical protein
MIEKLAMTRRALLAGTGSFALVTSVRASESLPKVGVTKDPSCGCCGGWVEHLRQADFPVEVTDAADVNRVKVRLGVPKALPPAIPRRSTAM